MKIITQCVGMLLGWGICAFAQAQSNSNSNSTDTPISATAWKNHPSIVASRKVYQAVQARSQEDAFYVQIKKMPYCKAYVPDYKEIRQDRHNTVRFYMTKAGSGDSHMTMQVYYDDNGKRRFAFLQAGAVIGSQVEKRIYFDNTGKQIWENTKVLEGGNYFGDSLKVYGLEKPKAAFTQANECEKAFTQTISN